MTAPGRGGTHDPAGPRRQGASRWATLALLRLAIVGGFALCAGCLLIPVPDVEVNSRLVDAAAVRFIRHGETTREEVLLALGAPDAVRDGEDVFVYDSQYRTGSRLLMIPICAPGQKDSKATELSTELHRVRVEVAFDGAARVRSVQIEKDGAK